MKQSIKFILVVVLLAYAAVPGFAQAAGDWSAVQNLSSGRKLIVRTREGRELKAKFVSATDSAITVRTDGRGANINRDAIDSVYGAKQGSRLKSAFRGAVFGGLIGVGVLGAYTIAAKADPLIPVAGVLYGVPTGAAIGAAAGGKSKKGELIYKAP